MTQLSDYEKGQIITQRAFEVLSEYGYSPTSEDLWGKCSGYGVYVVDGQGFKANTFAFFVRHTVKARDRKVFDDLKKVTFQCDKLGDTDCHFDYDVRTPAYLGGPTGWTLLEDLIVKKLRDWNIGG